MRRISNKAALSTLDIIKFPNNVLSLSVSFLFPLSLSLSLSVRIRIYLYILAALHKAQSQQERL